jgi:hypothetical protein
VAFAPRPWYSAPLACLSDVIMSRPRQRLCPSRLALTVLAWSAGSPTNGWHVVAGESCFGTRAAPPETSIQRQQSSALATTPGLRASCVDPNRHATRPSGLRALKLTKERYSVRALSSTRLYEFFGAEVYALGSDIDLGRICMQALAHLRMTTNKGACGHYRCIGAGLGRPRRSRVQKTMAAHGATANLAISAGTCPGVV